MFSKMRSVSLHPIHFIRPHRMTPIVLFRQHSSEPSLPVNLRHPVSLYSRSQMTYSQFLSPIRKLHTLQFKQKEQKPTNDVQQGAGRQVPVAKVERRLLMSFRCKPCGGNVTKTISRHSYENGVVLIQCPHCMNRHLIADNLNWFGDKKQNVETILKEKGEEVRHLNSADPNSWPEGVLEFLNKEDGRDED